MGVDRWYHNNLKQGGFTKAMKVADNHTITILDKKEVIFTIIWYCFELFPNLVDSEQDDDIKEAKSAFSVVYTAHTHPSRFQGGQQALGIILEGALIGQGIGSNH